mgnify:CR=1 FL=1
MKNLNNTIFSLGTTLFITLILNSCSPCRNLDCLSSRYDFEFRILDANSGEDLVFGSNAIFKFGELSVFSLQGNQQQMYPLEAKTNSFFQGDTTLRVEVFPKTDRVFLRYPNGRIDTLLLTFREFDSECCGRITEITEIERNQLQKFTNLREPMEFMY